MQVDESEDIIGRIDNRVGEEDDRICNERGYKGDRVRRGVEGTREGKEGLAGYSCARRRGT